MKPAQERMRAELDAVEFADLTTPLVNNWQAREVRTGAEAREGLYQQIPNSVLWTQTIRYLAAQGVDVLHRGRAGSRSDGLAAQHRPDPQRRRSSARPSDLEKL